MDSPRLLRAGRSLIPLHRASEFAGLAFDVQRQRIARGLEFCAAMACIQNCSSRRVMASIAIRSRAAGTRHGTSLRRLCARAVCAVRRDLDSDAALVSGAPHRGLWTICIHPNTADDAVVEELRRFLIGYASQFTSFDRVVAEFEPKALAPFERGCELIATARLRFHRARSRRRSR